MVLKYIILKKAKPYTRVKRGKLERVKGYTGKVGKKVFHGTSADKVFNILFGGVKPQIFHNWSSSLYKEGRDNRIFAAIGEDSFKIAGFFARQASKNSGKSAVIIEAVVPDNYYWSNLEIDLSFIKGVARAGPRPCISLPEIKPEWITNVYDENGEFMTKTINSLTLERFDKSGNVVFIPMSVELFKKILKIRPKQN